MAVASGATAPCGAARFAGAACPSPTEVGITGPCDATVGRAVTPGWELERLHRGDEIGQALLRISEEHAGLGVDVELVVDACVAAAHRALDDDDRLRVVDV